MPDKFIVPQFIDNEDKILGPITVRQFILSLVGFFVIFIEFRLLTLPFFIPSAAVTAGVVGTFGFVKINGQPFHIFFLNFVQTLIRPDIRVWDKNPTDAELRVLLHPQTAPPPPPPPAHKAHPGSTRLRDLSLTVNTGGVYVPDEG
ncbi:MAG: PrgI family protein [Candidatus Parcubacteria bacterium]|jgi:hypothetical protein